MVPATTRELYEYWNRVRGGERAPLRSAIEPSDIRQILGEMFILEVLERDNYYVRLAGTRVCALYCREIKGTNLLDLWSGEDRHAMATLAAAVSEDGAAAVVTIVAETARDQQVPCELICCRSATAGPPSTGGRRQLCRHGAPLLAGVRADRGRASPASA